MFQPRSGSRKTVRLKSQVLDGRKLMLKRLHARQLTPTMRNPPRFFSQPSKSPTSALVEGRETSPQVADTKSEAQLWPYQTEYQPETNSRRSRRIAFLFQRGGIPRNAKVFPGLLSGFLYRAHDFFRGCQV